MLKMNIAIILSLFTLNTVAQAAVTKTDADKAKRSPAQAHLTESEEQALGYEMAQAKDGLQELTKKFMASKSICDKNKGSGVSVYSFSIPFTSDKGAQLSAALEVKCGADQK